MTASLVCGLGLALVIVGCFLAEMSYLGRIPLEERAGRTLAVIGTVVCVAAVLASPH